MIELDAEIVGERVHALEPVIEPVEEIGILAALAQLLARDRMTGGAGAIEHHVHVDEDFVGVLGLGEPADFEPEISVVHAGDVRDEAALLQIAARQRAVKIVDQGGAGAVGTAHGVGHGRPSGTESAGRSTDLAVKHSDHVGGDENHQQRQGRADTAIIREAVTPRPHHEEIVLVTDRGEEVR